MCLTGPPASDYLEQREPETYFKIGSYGVTRVTRDSAYVGCQRVTKADLELLLELMRRK